MDPTPRPILHIEDEENDIHLLQRALVSAEVWNPVQVVKNAARAFAYLLGEEPFADRAYYPQPSLILLDLSLPTLDGLEILKWRQLHPGIKEIPVLVLTGSHNAGEIRAAYEAGANGYLVKPAGFNEWVELVKAIRIFWLTHNVLPLPFARKINTLECHANGNGELTRSAFDRASVS
jgi:CheY-like chemotaxis protein